MLQVLVHSAAVQERAGARRLLQKVGFDASRMQLIWADSGYWGAPFAEWVQAHRGWKVEVVSRNELVNRRKGTPAFVALPRRWVVERTFAWLGRWRRLAHDYEHNPRSSEAWIFIAMIGLLLKRLHE